MKSRNQSPLEKGIVKWFEKSKGLGFIKLRDGKDILLRIRSADPGPNVEFNEGDSVECEVTNDYGGSQIKSIRKV